MQFKWDESQRHPDGRLLLLYRHQRVFDEGIIQSGHRVLDVGGWGMFAQAVLEFRADCCILDLFTRDQYYPERVRALPHRVGDVRDPHVFPPESFDVVTCFETLEHCGDISAAVTNMVTWLKSSGTLVGTVPVPGGCHAADEPGIEFISAEALHALLVSVGLVQILIEPTASLTIDSPITSLYFRGVKP